MKVFLVIWSCSGDSHMLDKIYYDEEKAEERVIELNNKEHDSQRYWDVSELEIVLNRNFYKKN